MRIAMLSIILASTPAFASPLACPPGTSAYSWKSETTIYETCKRPDGTPHGPIRAITGTNVDLVGSFVDGKQDGLQVISVGGARVSEMHYDHGVLEGVWREWSTNGTLTVERHYRHDQPEGTWQEWYATGTPKSVVTYVDGKEDGRQRGWNETGELVTDGMWSAGKSVGAWLENGSRGSYCSGKRCGHWQIVIADDKLVIDGTYREGRRDGAWTTSWDGKRESRAMYRHGQKQGLTEQWDLVTGNKIESIECSNGVPSGIRRAWWPDGKLRLLGRYVAGKLDGTWIVGDGGGERSRGIYKRGEYVSGARVDPDENDFEPDGEGGVNACRADAVDDHE